MPRRLILTEDAINDLDAVRGWQRQPGSGAAGRRRVKAIPAAIRELRAAPCRFRRGDDPGTRQLTLQRHVVIYEVDPDTGENATAGDVRVLRGCACSGPGSSGVCDLRAGPRLRQLVRRVPAVRPRLYGFKGHDSACSH